MKSPITTHVLDTARGRPAAGVGVVLSTRTSGDAWRDLAHGTTDADGRISTLLSPDDPVDRGIYRLMFDVADYFSGQASFYAKIPIIFTVDDPTAHYHVPLLLSPFGYTTYRGS